nr:hypothetical protein [Rubripirellula sp.]
MDRSKRIRCAAGYAKPNRSNPSRNRTQRAAISFLANDHVQSGPSDLTSNVAGRLFSGCGEVNFKKVSL